MVHETKRLLLVAAPKAPMTHHQLGLSLAENVTICNNHDMHAFF